MKLEKILKPITLIGTFIVPFLPLLVSSSMFFPFITGKNFAFRIIVEIIFAAWLILAIFDKSYRPKKSWILISLTAVLGVLTLATIFGANPYHSFWSNYERMEGLISHFHFFAYFLVLISILKSGRYWFWLLHTSLFANLIIGIYSLFQIAGVLTINQGGVRVDGTFGNASYLAIYQLFHIFFLAYLLLSSRTKNWWLRGSYSLVLILDIFIVYKTATRGVILGLIGGAFITALILAIFERERRVVRKISAGLVVGLLALTAIFFAWRDSDLVRNSQTLSRLASISFQDNPRFLVWNMSWQGFKERPVLGWGPENYNLVFNKYYDPKMYSQEQWFDRSHNIVFDWLISAGFLGLLAYLSVFASVFYYLWRRRDLFNITDRAVFTGLLIAYFFQNLFVFDNLTSYLLFFGFLAYLHHRVSSAAFLPVKNFLSETSDLRRLLFPTIAVSVLLIIGLYFFNLKPIQASDNLIQAITRTDNPEKNLESFKRVFSLNTFGSTEAREQLVQLAISINQAKVPPELKEKFFDLANSEMIKQLEQTPNDARYHIFYGSFLSRLGNPGAVDQLKKALSLSPKKQTMMFELGSFYLTQKNYPEAITVFKEAFDLEPRFNSARELYGLALVYSGKQKEAEEILRPIYPTPEIIDSDSFLNAYQETKQFTKVITVRQNRVKADPSNVQKRVFLAAAHYTAGNRSQAVAELREAIKLEPSFKAEGESYIEEILSGRSL